MGEWIARYEEGFVTTAGLVECLTNQVHEEVPWRTPADARRHWSRRADLSGPDVRPYGNGFEQIHDVRDQPEFALLGVVTIWRRVSFISLKEASS